MSARLSLIALALLWVSCGGNGSPTAPTSPGGSAPSPSQVNVVGTWRGPFSDYEGPGTMTWTITIQNGGQIRGSVSIVQNLQSPSGPLTGTVTGFEIGFHFTLGSPCASGCPTDGNARVEGNRITGTYTGQNQAGFPTRGQFDLTRQ